MEEFKLLTRRVLAWGIGLPITYTLCAGLIYGLVKGQMEVVTLCAGILGTAIGSVIGFYFGKKVAEE